MCAMDAHEFAAFTERERARWAKVIDELTLKID
jgi:hypothetical protein